MSLLQPEQQALEATCRSAYTDIQKRWIEHISSNKEQPPYYGYKILNGPPKYGASVVFLGYQPGGCMADHYKYLEDQDQWPKQLQYLNGDEKLWKEIKKIFAKDGCLDKCMGMNAIYFRAPSIAEWKKGWAEDKRRINLETTCLMHTESILRATSPKLIVAIGYKIADHVPSLELLNNKGVGKNIVKQAKMFGIDALITPHLSSVRMTTEERNIIYQDIRRSAQCD